MFIKILAIDGRVEYIRADMVNNVFTAHKHKDETTLQWIACRDFII
jgi:hypothetical protein